MGSNQILILRTRYVISVQYVCMYEFEPLSNARSNDSRMQLITELDWTDNFFVFTCAKPKVRFIECR